MPTEDRVNTLEVANDLRPLILHLNRHLRRELQPLGVTAVQAALLYAVRTTPGIGVRELAAREGLSAPRVTVAVNGLEAAGLVRRTRSREDRRRVRVEVTDEGLRVLRAARRRRTAWLAARLERLGAADRAALADSVPAFRRLLENA